MKKLRQLIEEEKGSVMIIGAAGLMIVIMFMALAVDLGMYYSSYRKLKSAADFVDEEVQQMLPYYAYVDNYEHAFRTSLYKAIDSMGYSADNIVDYEIRREKFVSGNWNIMVETEVVLEDNYRCIFLGIIGANEFTLRAENKKTQTMAIEEPYRPGMPYDVWGEED